MIPQFYVNGSDFPPEDETVADGSIFHRADGQMMRRVQGKWFLLSELEPTKTDETTGE